MTAQRPAAELRSDLSRRLELCGYDELRVVSVLLARLELGRAAKATSHASKPHDWPGPFDLGGES